MTDPRAYDRKGKGRAVDAGLEYASDDHHIPPARESERWTAANVWRESRKRAKQDRRSWDYILSSGIAGGVAGCVAKTAIAPLDRVKILFQTSNADFRKYAGTPMGLLHAQAKIWKSQGVYGLFQGHSMTLLRVFPYAGIKFMAYDWLEGIIIPTPDHRTPARFFVTGAMSGVMSVFFTYPLELIRVRLAFQTKQSERTSILNAIKSIYGESERRPASSSSTGRPPPLATQAAAMSTQAAAAAAGTAASAAGTTPTPTGGVSPFVRSLPLYPFYRGFSITIIGMIPYAGVSFLTYGTLKRYISGLVPSLADRPTAKDLTCGAVAGMVSQTASYPFEVVRRRMQVGGVQRGGGVSWREAVRDIYAGRGIRGFFVGLSIGYLKVVPMTSISFATWQLMKRLMEI